MIFRIRNGAASPFVVLLGRFQDLEKIFSGGKIFATVSLSPRANPIKSRLLAFDFIPHKSREEKVNE